MYGDPMRSLALPSGHEPIQHTHGKQPQFQPRPERAGTPKATPTAESAQTAFLAAISERDGGEK